MLKRFVFSSIILLFMLINYAFCENILFYKNLIPSPVLTNNLSTPFILIDNNLYFYSYGTILYFDGNNVHSFFNVSSKIDSNIIEQNGTIDKLAYIPIKKEFVISVLYTYYNENFQPFVKSKIFFINFDGSYQIKDITLDDNSTDTTLYNFYKDDNGTLYLCKETDFNNNCFLISDKDGNTDNFGKVFSFNTTTQVYKETNIIEYDETTKLKIYNNYGTNIVSSITNYDYSYNNSEIKYIKRFKFTTDYSYTKVNAFISNNKISVLIAPYVYDEENYSAPIENGYLIINEDLDNLLTNNVYDENSVFNVDNTTSMYINFSDTINEFSEVYYPVYLNGQLFIFGNLPEIYKLENNNLNLYTEIYPFINNNFAYNGSIVAWVAPKSIVYYNKLTGELRAVYAPFVNSIQDTNIYSVFGNKFLILNPKYSSISPEDNPDCQASSCYNMVVALFDENLNLINKDILQGYYISNPWGSEKIYPYDIDNKTLCVNYEDMTTYHDDHFYCYDDSLNLKYKIDGDFMNGVFYKNYFIGNAIGTGEIIDLINNNIKMFSIDDYMNIVETDKYAVFAGRVGNFFTTSGYKIFNVTWDKLLSFDPQTEDISNFKISEYTSDKSIGAIYPLAYGDNIYIIGSDFNKSEDYTIVQFNIDNNGIIKKIREFDLNNFDDPQNLVIADYDGNAHFLYNKDNNIYEIQLSSTTNQFTLNLSSGWNLVGNPFKSNINIETFSNSKIVSVWKWSNRWEVYSPTKNIQKIIKKYNIPQISYISPLNGLWINAKENSTIQINGIFGNIDDVVNSINFTWTLLTTGEDINNTILREKFNNVKSIWKWSNNKWEIWTPLLKLKELLKKYKIPEIEQIDIGEGFWINK